MWEVRIKLWDMQSAIHLKKDFVLEPLHKAAEIFRRMTAEFLLDEEAANFTMLMIMIMMKADDDNDDDNGDGGGDDNEKEVFSKMG